MHLKEELQVANGKRTTMHESLDIPEDCESEKERERERESQIFQNPPKYIVFILDILTWCSYFCLAPGGLEQLNHEAAFWPHQANSLLMMLKAWWKTEVIVLTQIVNRSFGMPIIICKLHFFNNTTQSSTGMPG